MKSLPDGLQRMLTYIRIPLIIIMLLFFLMWMQFKYPSGCGYRDWTTSINQGYFEAVVEEECCWGCVYTIILRKANGWSGLGFDTKVFVYEPASSVYGSLDTSTHEPVVIWLSPNELEIAVDRLGSIHKQLSKARGVKIEYHIGSVDYP